jgi:hypothetical protein
VVDHLTDLENDGNISTYRGLHMLIMCANDNVRLSGNLDRIEVVDTIYEREYFERTSQVRERSAQTWVPVLN